MSRDVRIRHDESGGALVMALLAVIMLAGLSTVFVARAVTESRVTAAEREWETAIHVAEAGSDAVIEALNENIDAITLSSGGASHVYDLASNATTAEQRAWALAIADDPAQCDVITLDGGEVCAIRPVTTAGADLPYIYAVGFVPGRATPDGDRVERVVKLGFDEGFYSPQHAIFTQGSLTIGGSTQLGIAGSGGNVHTNSDLTIEGSPTVSGTLTYSGTASGSAQDEGGAPNPPVAGPPLPLPQVTARHLYDEAASYVSFDGPTYTGDWYDLCDDGTVRIPDTSEPLTPCSGTVLWNGGTAKFRGWEPSGDDWRITGSPDGDEVSGIYYVQHRDVDISGSPGSDADPARVSIFIEAVARCVDPGGADGSLTLSGNVDFQPFMPDMLFVADRDIDISGNPEQPNPDYQGFVGAHEQIELSGNPELRGAFVAEDACHTTGSPVSANSISGSVTVTFTSNMEVPLRSVIRITAWNEY